MPMDPERSVYVQFLLDANRINSKGRLPHTAQLERWRDDEVILLNMSDTSQLEAARGDSARARKAFGYIYTITPSPDRADEGDLEKFRSILFPAGVHTQNQENDVRIVYNAFVFQAILVTADTDILHRRVALQAMGVRIMTDEEAVLHVRERLNVRDDNLREEVRRTARSLPVWVGRD